MRPLDYTGTIFKNGKQVLKFIRRSASGDNYYKYRCSCGMERVTNLSSIKHSKGCYICCRRRNEKGETGLRILYSYYKVRAKRRNLIFNLDLNYFKKLTSKNCFYCNEKPIRSRKQEYASKETKILSEYFFNGIDRKNPKKGYVKGNVVACCKDCNYAKRTLSQKQFKELIIKIYKHWANR